MKLLGHYQFICYLVLVTQILGQPLVSPVPTTYELYNNSLLMNAFYKRASPTGAAPDGAISVNHQWEIKNATQWFIEEQRYGCDHISAAIFTNRSDLLEYGEKIFNWGFARQTPDGGFNNCSDCNPPGIGTGDPFHSTSMFVEAVAKCLVLMRQSPNFPLYESYFNTILPKLVEAVNWLTDPAVMARGIANDKPYTHRRYILAATLGQTALLTTNQTLQQHLYTIAATFAENGLALQNSSGFNPEKGGYDSSYNAVGLYYACNYLVVCPNNTLQQRLGDMLSKSLSWELTRMFPNGSANLTGNTRVTGNNKTDEKGPSGKFKGFDYILTTRAFEFGSILLQNETLHNESRLVATYAGFLPKQWIDTIKSYFT
jgi:hypothetical protein